MTAAVYFTHVESFANGTDLKFSLPLSPIQKWIYSEYSGFLSVRCWKGVGTVRPLLSSTRMALADAGKFTFFLTSSVADG